MKIGFIKHLLCLIIGCFKKLSSILLIMLTNLDHGTAKLSTSEGTQGRADTSNIPSIVLGCCDCSSL